MSQLRDISGKLRAAIAIVVVFALAFGASATGAASATDVALKSKSSVSGGLFACFKRHVTQRTDTPIEAASAKPAPEGDHAGKHHCPCCLAASSATAVLPARAPAAAARRPTPEPVFYAELTVGAPKAASSRCAHGARAPPAQA
jgi:hypothetical protein